MSAASLRGKSHAHIGDGLVVAESKGQKSIR